jgi:SAM-dependent methyltransferase
MAHSKSLSGQRTSWEPIAQWYDGWVGPQGSDHHQKMALPMIDELLTLPKNSSLLDVGCGQGVLAPHLADRHYTYLGIDASQSLIELANKRHGKLGTFFFADATKVTPEWLQKQLKFLPAHAPTPKIPEKFDGAVFLLSIQDMDPLSDVIARISELMAPKSQIVLIMTHPCFRIPRQSGWDWDEKRKLTFRRIDRYLSALSIPLKAYSGNKKGVSLSFHRPLHEYVNGFAAHGFAVTKMLETPTYKTENTQSDEAKSMNKAHQEIPLFLGLRFERK